MTGNTTFVAATFVSIITAIGCGRMQNATACDYFPGGDLMFTFPFDGGHTEAPGGGFRDLRVSVWRLILKAYAGNHSSYVDNAPPDAVRSTREIGGVQADRLEWRRSGSVHVEVLLPFKRSLEWPEQIHFSFEGLTSEEREVAELIISFLRSSTTH